MAHKKGRRRRFGAVRQYRSGSWAASCLAPDGERVRAEETFETKAEETFETKAEETFETKKDAEPVPDQGCGQGVRR
ncbi:hypothetical protein [Streptomyces mirabilis]|uniref:hypothetical protein n=1 Tax=Streptomyces mirabilis TaxID=68239 RepID=UPI003BEED058